MVYSLFSAIIAFFSLAIIRDKDISFNCPVKIKTFSIASLIFMLNSARAVDRFFTVLSASVKSFFNAIFAVPIPDIEDYCR
jgi:hypothetical protein